MSGERARGSVAGIVLTGLFLSAVCVAAHAQDVSGSAGVQRPNTQSPSTPGGGDVDQLNNAARNLYLKGRYKEALEFAQRALAAAERQHGPDHAVIGRQLNNLGVLYNRLNRTAEAEQAYTRAVAVHEKALGPEHLELALSLYNLASHYRFIGRYADSEMMQKRALAIREKVRGPAHPDVAQSLGDLAELYRLMDRNSEAEPLHLRALALREKLLGPDHVDVATSLKATANLYLGDGRYSDAERLQKRALAIREKAYGADHASVADLLVDLGAVYRLQGRLGEAEIQQKRALVIHEKVFGPDHVSVGEDLNQIGILYRNQRRFAEAEPLLKRSLMIRERTLGPNHRAIGASANAIAELYVAQFRYADAEPYYKRAIDIQEKTLGPHHRLLGNTLFNLGQSYRGQGRYAEAETLYKRALAIHERALPPGHPDLGLSLARVALLYRARGNLVEAERLMQRALEIRERALGSNHPAVARDISGLAFLEFGRGDWAQAARYWRRSTALLRRHAAGEASGERDGESSEVQHAHWQFRGLVKAVYRAGEDRRGNGAAAREMFEIAQWAEASGAASSVAQMAARGASNDPGLAGLARERQDLTGEWQMKDRQLIAAKSMTPDKRKADGEAALAQRLVVIDARIAEIDRLFAKDYPDYAALGSTRPVSVADVQLGLRDDEALVVFFDTQSIGPQPEETFVWVVTKSGLRWVPTKFGREALTREVEALRCGLDATAWSGKGAERCAARLGLSRDGIPAAGEPLPFDTARAHRLYLGLFDGVQDLIKGKHLLIVPSGPLTQLPFQVLVTRPPPEIGDLRTVSWLVREHAMTVLPAPSSLKALRRIARPSSASQPMIGFGNPLLDGPDDRYAELAKLARDTQRCPDKGWRRRLGDLVALRRGVETVATRGGFADPMQLKHQTPLPETADELCAVARDVKADVRELRLGARATEGEVKALSARGELARYRIVHFATHATLANQLKGVAEPGLILTPPEQADDNDDGYLSASEIAGLKLDADWVILSACNTAAGSGGQSEALSGLARAFIYAGARALLVSHWAVDSDAAVKIVTAAVREIARNPRVGRSEALRRATLALIAAGEGQRHIRRIGRRSCWSAKARRNSRAAATLVDPGGRPSCPLASASVEPD